jgi:hypothetical protein
LYTLKDIFGDIISGKIPTNEIPTPITEEKKFEPTEAHDPKTNEEKPTENSEKTLELTENSTENPEENKTSDEGKTDENSSKTPIIRVLSSPGVHLHGGYSPNPELDTFTIKFLFQLDISCLDKLSDVKELLMKQPQLENIVFQVEK